jgi:flagellar M-ring protein FliF
MGRLIGIAVGGLVSFALIYFLMAQMGGTPMTPLLYGLSQDDSIKIQAALNQQGVEYETLSGGSTIMVEEGHATRLRVQFAGEGIGTGSIVGYEIFDKSETLGSTNFVQNINRVRALEGELTRTIMSINSVESARVHLTIAKRELFQREKETAKATVVIRSRGGAPDNNTVRAIQHIVANSVAGLSPSNVTIADETGGLLASGNGNYGGLGGNSSIEEKIYSIEERTRQKVYEILSGVIPIGKARVQVQVDVERDSITEDSLIFDPDGQVVRVTESKENTQERTDSEGADKAVSVANSLPGANLNETLDVAGPKKVDKSRDVFEKISYATSQTKRLKVIQPGEVKRLSVAVIVDGNYTQAADGTRTYQQRTDAELAQLTRLIEGAIGFSEQRGDTIVVQSMEFAAVELPEGIEISDGMMGFSSAQLVEVLKTLIIGVIVLLLTLLVIRPLMKAALTPVPGGQLALAGAGGVSVDGDLQALAGGQPIAGQLPPPADATAAPVQATQPGSIQSQIDIAKIEGEVQASSLKKVGELVENHPDETVAIIRNWLHNEE